ncbi:MAG TPA: type II toxin-antitoxin system RelE/ParE family toxin [Cellvibrionaceae bacterium]|nr:type II toxin-antitoxin system RelE/ParE family toxin [Cellvibrionaceae bacterium]
MTSRIFTTKTFRRWMGKADITDQALVLAIREMEQGLIDADLGGHLFKKRVALQGQGKRGGARTIVASNIQGRWFFIYGFIKNERDNISPVELKALHVLAKQLLELNDIQLKKALSANEITEVHHV